MFAGRVHLRTVLAGSIFASMSALPALASQPLHRPAPGESDAATSLAAVDGKHHAEAARLPARLARVVDLYAREHAFSGTIMLSHRGQLVFSRSLGMADEGWGIPNAPDTRYRIASMTKAFTALAVLKLHQARRLKLDSPIRDLVPGQDPRITIRHLLLHRSGLARDPADLSDKGMESRFTLAEIAGIAARSTLAFEPGTDYAYSNIGYSLLAAAIEAATGQAYEQSLRTLVLDPMSLGETFNEPSARPLPHLARGYFMLPGWTRGRERGRQVACAWRGLAHLHGRRYDPFPGRAGERSWNLRRDPRAVPDRSGEEPLARPGDLGIQGSRQQWA